MVKVIVPASSANLGAGFDTLAIAVKIYNTFIFEELDDGFELKGSMFDYNSDTNLTYVAMMKTFRKVGYSPSGIRMYMDTDIPIARGLGSSAACILGGIIGANELAGRPLSREEIVELAIEIEGHSDNITAQMYGGVTCSIEVDGRFLNQQVKVPEGIALCPLIPDIQLETAESRAVLPRTVDYKDALFNLARSSYLVAALSNGDWDNLKHGFKDKLHEPYRANLIPNFEDVCQMAEEAGSLGSYISGGGPTIITLKHSEDSDYLTKIRSSLTRLPNNWSATEVGIDVEGTRIIREARNT